MPMTFVKPRLLRFGSNNVTDHNRSPLGISIERIEKKHRMANGRLRKYVVADKHTFNVSWDMLPANATYTVDGYWGANDLENFFNTTKGEFILGLSLTNTGPATTYTVMFSDFSKTLLKRGRFDFYDVSLTLEEV